MTAQKIINGPSKWDIMLSFFEGMTISFTLEDGVVVEIDDIECMWNMTEYISLTPNADIDNDDANNRSLEGFLLRGLHDSSEKIIFIEYYLRSRKGYYAAVEDVEAESSFLPKVWSEIMGMNNFYTD